MSKNLLLALLLCLSALWSPWVQAVSPESGLWAIESEMDGRPGRGFQIDYQGNTLGLTFFGYLADGSAQWYIASGTLVNDAFSAPLETYRGGMAFGGERRPGQSSGSPGMVSIQFTDATHGTIRLPNEAPKAIVRFRFAQATTDPLARARDILHTALEVDLAARSAVATIDLAAATDPAAGAVFEVSGLTLRRVSAGGVALAWRINAGRLEVDLPAPASAPARISIEYALPAADPVSGLLTGGATFIWPYHCGKLFPCHSNPADGAGFALNIRGTPAGQTTIYAPQIAEAPAYQLAWATGNYAVIDLGVTASGLRVKAFAPPALESAARDGTRLLRATLEWFERSYGPYPYGNETGAVAVSDNPGFGGMEHHPYWHVGGALLADPLTHAHEAAHGWIGGGARIACWEDFALSEGTASYMAARALGAVSGAAEEDRVWQGYRARLRSAMLGAAPKIARPEGCGAIDVLQDGLFSDIPYLKGALFWKSLEARIGKEAVDLALRSFFNQYRYRAAGFVNAVETVFAATGYDAAACAHAWLKLEALPSSEVCA